MSKIIVIGDSKADTFMRGVRFEEEDSLSTWCPTSPKLHLNVRYPHQDHDSNFSNVIVCYCLAHPRYPFYRNNLYRFVPILSTDVKRRLCSPIRREESRHSGTSP